MTPPRTRPVRGRRAALALLAAGVLAGCADRTGSMAPEPAADAGAAQTWSVVPADALTSAERGQRQRAVAARDAMFGELLSTLTTQLAAAGPAGAIEVCRDVAPQIARRTADARGVAIGRTSWKLRNPANAGPPWVQPLVAGRPATEVVARSEDGRLGVILPIRMMPACVTCHGPRESIPPDVRDALARTYPDDRATGFEPGALRGWFWIEVPADPS